jgi:hypothetical protein
VTWRKQFPRRTGLGSRKVEMLRVYGNVRLGVLRTQFSDYDTQFVESPSCLYYFDLGLWLQVSRQVPRNAAYKSRSSMVLLVCFPKSAL